jgi:predicted patatin/cPLA2 family phospholipase
MKKDLVFVFFGGTMTGIFGAGAVKALHQLHLEKRIQSIYASSAGAHNAAYFLAGNVRPVDIYYEDMSQGKFLRKKRIFPFVGKLIIHLFNPRLSLEKVLDLDYLLEIEEKKKKLDVTKIEKSEIDFWVRVFNVNSQKWEYLNGKKDVFKKLKATSAAVPFYPSLVRINHQDYCDGETLLPGLDAQLAKEIDNHPEKHFFLILNASSKEYFPFSSLIGNFFWTFFLFLYFGKTFVFQRLKNSQRKKRIEQYRHRPNVTFISPDFTFPVYCTSQKKLHRLYDNGFQKTKEAMLNKGILNN